MKTIKWGQPASHDRPNTPEALDARMAVAKATIAARNASIMRSAQQTILLSKVSIGLSGLALLCSLFVIGHRSGWW